MRRHLTTKRSRNELRQPRSDEVFGMDGREKSVSRAGFSSGGSARATRGKHDFRNKRWG
jgi:hypothetical protein